MDFPIFHLDFIGNRFLIALIAIVHVFVNHPMAVGAIPLITLMEWWGKRSGDKRWDDLAYKILLVCFIITTSVGALTGVGIWFSTSLVNPYAIGSLIRVFFWAWFSEWIVFVTEVILILAYFLLWKRMEGEKKSLHIALGVVLSIASWLTMAIIVGILGYMMDVGNWNEGEGLVTAFLNPVYLPQLAFRTPLAMATAGMFALFLSYFFTEKGSHFQLKAMRFISIWSVAWVPLCLAGGLWYWKIIPESMVGNVDVAIATQVFADRYEVILNALLFSFGLSVLILTWSVIKPSRLPRLALVLPFVVALLTLGYFERVREFIRKPYVIQNYMYANGIRVADYPLLNQRGILPYSVYSDVKMVTEDNSIQAGEEVFKIACTRCHTTNGMNGILSKFETMYGQDRWDKQSMVAYINGMHNVRPFMPPFPGNQAEVAALVEYILSLRDFPVPVKGAQTVKETTKQRKETILGFAG